MLAEVTAREIGRVTIAEALELTALVARKQPERYGRFAARWLCLYLEEYEKARLEHVDLLVSNLRSLSNPKGPRAGARDLEEDGTPDLTGVAIHQGPCRVSICRAEGFFGANGRRWAMRLSGPSALVSLDAHFSHLDGWA